MDHYAGIDVSLEQSSVCVVDATGKIARKAKVASEPSALTQSEGAGSRANLAKMVPAGLVQTKRLDALLCSRM